MASTALAVLWIVIVSCFAATPDQWRRDVIYQLLTDRFASGSSGACSNLKDYCGGTYQEAIKQLDYVQGLGATAMWISPIPDNVDGGYHGYWQRNMSQVNQHFGTAADLKAFVNASHQRNMKVMVDVVINHVGPQVDGKNNDFSYYEPFHNASDFHSYCEIQDWSDPHQVENCRLSNLPDLAQENPAVASYLQNWIANAIKEFGFDGIRFDTVLEVPLAYWKQYTSYLDVYTVGEVDNGDPAVNAPYQGALSGTLNYPMYWGLRNVFQEKQSMWELSKQWKQVKADFADVQLLGLFVDNHDNPRFLSINSDETALANALAWIMFAEGIPIIYYGTEQGFDGSNDPYNREDLWRSNYNNNTDLYKFIKLLNEARQQLPDTFFRQPQYERYVMDDFYCYVRGSVIIATTNGGSGHTTGATVPDLPFSDGTRFVDVLDNSYSVTVNGGTADISISGGLPRVLMVPPSLA